MASSKSAVWVVGGGGGVDWGVGNAATMVAARRTRKRGMAGACIFGLVDGGRIAEVDFVDLRLFGVVLILKKQAVRLGIARMWWNGELLGSYGGYDSVEDGDEDGDFVEETRSFYINPDRFGRPFNIAYSLVCSWQYCDLVFHNLYLSYRLEVSRAWFVSFFNKAHEMSDSILNTHGLVPLNLSR